MYKVVENRKCPKWPHIEIEHLTVKRTLYTLYAYTRGPNFGPFRSTISYFRDTYMYKVGENRKCTERPQTELKHLTV